MTIGGLQGLFTPHLPGAHLRYAKKNFTPLEVRRSVMPDTGTIAVNLWDSTRQPLQPANDVFLSVRDSASPPKFYGPFFVRAGVIRVPLNVHDNNDDNYAVVASTKGCSDAGFFPVRLESGPDSPIHVMLAPRKPVFNFTTATWDVITNAWPDLHRFLAGSDEATAKANFQALSRGDTAPRIACLLNIAAAIRSFSAKVGVNLLQNFHRVQLIPAASSTNAQGVTVTEGLQQDRFYAWVDKSLLDFIESKAASEVVTNAEPPIFLKLLHGADADASYKEIRFGEANLQFTFHSKEIDPSGLGLIKVEMDIDYYKDAVAHGALEVIPNAVEKWVGATGLTDPAMVYVLRWMAGKNLNEPALFDPLYTLQAPSTFLQLG